MKYSVRKYIRDALNKIDRTRYRQESKYTTALLISLEGAAYDGQFGRVVFTATDIDDRGSGAAERWSGADCIITADISDNNLRITKAITIQAKIGDIERLTGQERERLNGQIRDMKQLTKSPKILEYPRDGEDDIPRVRSGNRVLANLPTIRMGLDDYIIRRVLTTLDGDTRPEYVEAVQHSSLPQLRVSTEFAR